MSVQPEELLDFIGVARQVDDEDVEDRGEDKPYFTAGNASVDRRSVVESIRSQIERGLHGSKRQGRARKPATPVWQIQLQQLASAQLIEQADRESETGRAWSKPRQIWYVLNLEQTQSRGLPCIELYQRAIKKNGNPGQLRPANLKERDIAALADPEDRALLGLIAGNEIHGSYGGMYHDSYYSMSTFAITEPMFEVVLPRLCASGRFGWPSDEDAVKPLAWDDGPAWSIQLRIAKAPDGKTWKISGELARGKERAELHSPLAVLSAGLIVFPDRIGKFEPGDRFHWASLLSKTGPISIPVKNELDLIERLASLPSPPAELPKELRWEETMTEPICRLVVTKSRQRWETDLECRLSFQYGEATVPFGGGQATWFDRSARRVMRRDRSAEMLAKSQLLKAGAKESNRQYDLKSDLFYLHPSKLTDLVFQLAELDWQVEAEGAQVRRAGEMKISVTSGVDWFDLEGVFDFDGITASLPELLASIERGERYVRLDDGSRGILPREWLERFGPLAELGKPDGDKLKFAPSQGALLDALLAAQAPRQVTVDKQFEKVRQRLRSFEGVAPRQEPKAFVGELRPYQREGLGWLHFLDEFGFGGCLADDMGLGKTIQVLALLEERRATAARARKSNGKQQPPRAPSLVVAPRSLVFNWIEEARRFAPKLRVLNYTGLGRDESFANLNEHDLVVTTYGTLRRDVARLEAFEFDYAILDEAQAIKNSASQSAKACRLLRARRRLAMTGTPVENHLDELWSLFEFLNPGMLGRNSKLSKLFGAGRKNGDAAPGDGLPERAEISRSDSDDAEAAGEEKDTSARPLPENISLLAKAIRPFLLRRTKQQVLTELPAKTEQTLHCELDAKERKRYEELREHYRKSLTAKIQEKGLQKSKIHVLEALLRLRQAACHPGLLDKTKLKDGSAKLDTLLEQLTEVVAEGHKALVFSQFTSLLAIVRNRLDEQGVVYEYLDGRTTKRQQKVERFQTDAACPLFLISLKAGGQGLNLTAADYVFILDPWWNPAVEAQAVDRAHRMGQERHVFAYRLIARDTVEEKILQLQDRKRNLAEAIVSADNSLLRNLTSEDLLLLLS
ncbi:MAG TPA: SNF2-related protein [Pirellulales bacterium]